MSYQTILRAIGSGPEQLEAAYHRAAAVGEKGAFVAAVEEAHSAQPDDLLYAAWHYRFAYAAAELPARTIAWLKALPLAVVNGLLLWLLSNPDLMIYRDVPEFILAWAPISGVMVLLFLAWAGAGRWARLGLVAAVLAALALFARAAYAWLGMPLQREHYLLLMAIHLPLLTWAGVGFYLLRDNGRARAPIFVFLLKSLETFIVGGLFAIAGGLFVAITVGLFEALGITLEEWVMRLLMAGGAGLLPLLAVAIVYDPVKAPHEQSFTDGLSRLIATLMRILLPLTLLVLIIYLGFIPFNFWGAFENRDVLIVYSGMLFAVMAMLVGATPPESSTLSPTTALWLRRGLVAVALSAALVGLYALAAIGYRTWQDGWTPNRFAFVGWNGINVAILFVLLWKQARVEQQRWLPALHNTLGLGAIVYAIWTVVVIGALPLIF